MRIMILSILTAIVALCSADAWGEATESRILSVRGEWGKMAPEKLLQLGNSYYMERNLPDSAFLCMSILVNRLQAMPTRTESDTRCYVVALNYISNLYKLVYYDYYKAHTYILQAKELAEQHYTDFLPYIYLTIGNLYLVESGMSLEKPNYDKALTAYRQGFSASLSSDQRNCISNLFINIAQVAWGEDMLSLIEQEIRQYAQLDIPYDQENREYAKALCMGIQLWQKGDRDEALHLFRSLPATLQLRPDDILMIITYDITYHALIKLGREQEALRQIDTMIAWAKKHDQPECLTDAYRYYYEYFKGKNDRTQTDRYELLWRQQRDSTINRIHMGSFQKAPFLFDIAKMNDQMRRLAYRKQMQQRILIITVVFSVFAIVMIVLLLISRKRIQQSYRQLYQKNHDLLAAEKHGQARDEADDDVAPESAPAQKYSHNQIDDEVSAEILRQVMHIMETDDEIFDDAFSIERLSDIMGTKKIYISQAINARTGQTFSTLLNDFRIKEACRRMSDIANYGHYSVEGIAQSVGYNSRSHFSKLFKNFTGLTPSAYQKMAREDR